MLFAIPRLAIPRPDIVAAVVTRDWQETLRNRLLLATILVPPVVLTIVPLIVGGVTTGLPLPAAVARQAIALRPDWASLTPGELTAALVIQQFLVFFLMMPAYIPLSIASYSIIGEKTSRSLEAVLATPIRTIELLAGKAISALLPGVVVGWLTYVALIGLTAMLYSPGLVRVVTDDSWLAGVFLLGPAVGLASVVAGVIVSARVSDPRTAQQIGGIIIVPLVGLAVIQASATVLFSGPSYALGALIVLVISFIGLWLGARLFGRETILTRWR
jgi:ABC-2 type transport system permease protein